MAAQSSRSLAQAEVVAPGRGQKGECVLKLPHTHRGYVGLMQVELAECLTGRGVADVVIEVYAARSSRAFPSLSGPPGPVRAHARARAGSVRRRGPVERVLPASTNSLRCRERYGRIRERF